ncbi:unnamed protein product, partial [Nippostrongylus brasiliensis]|uniref:Armadillo/beta-catenin-like repeat protein n=1 Tax=Nippostrongylus brasiliensis TaxID=27835 RepID=A0A0N4YZB2_NIPBR
QSAVYQPTSGASSVENIDPSNIFEINRQVNTLIMSLRHEDPEIRRKAANSVQSMARQRLLAMVSNHNTLRELICYFLQFVLEHTIEQNITQLMQSIFNILNCRTCFAVLQDRYIQQILIFGGLLSHGSTMLLHEILHCLAAVGDLKEALETQEIGSTIASVLQLMGAHDPILVNHGTAFLLNVSANSVRNKASMLAAQAPDTLLSVLNHRNNYLTIPIPNVRQLIASITDNVLICLANLTRGQDDCGRNACAQIARKPDSAKTLLNVLASGTVECQNRVLIVLYR